MVKIAPSILASDFSRLGDEIAKVEAAGADMIHLDIMDGHFVPNITIGPPVVKSLRKTTELPFDVHLMIEHADLYIDDFIEAGADIISVHIEKNPNIQKTIQHIKQKGVKASVVLKPDTKLSVLNRLLEEVDMVLLMTVNPGFGGQSYIEEMTEKVHELRKMADDRGIKLDIEVDGGIDLKNIRKVTEAGANVIVAGSTIYNAPDVAEMIRSLKEQAFGGKV